MSGLLDAIAGCASTTPEDLLRQYAQRQNAALQQAACNPYINGYARIPPNMQGYPAASSVREEPALLLLDPL